MKNYMYLGLGTMGFVIAVVDMYWFIIDLF